MSADGAVAGDRASKEAAVVFELAGWTVLTLRGRDCAKFLHNFCTADVKKLAAGEACEAFLTNVKARVVGHGIVFAEADEDAVGLTFVTVPEQGEKLAAHLDRYLITEKVTISDATAESAVLCVAGPEASERMRVAGMEPPRLGEPGLPGFFLPVRGEDKAAVLDRLSSAGVAAGTPEAFEALRVEACFPWYGVDVTEDRLAPEVGRPWAISYTKGCYLGQEPIARIDALGHVNRVLCGLRLDGGALPERGAAVATEGKEVGSVTSAATGNGDGRPVAMGYLKAKYAEAGTRVSVGDVGGTVFRAGG